MSRIPLPAFSTGGEAPGWIDEVLDKLVTAPPGAEEPVLKAEGDGKPGRRSRFTDRWQESCTPVSVRPRNSLF